MAERDRPTPPSQKGGKQLEPSTAGLRYIGFGMEFAATIVAAVALGYYADDYLGTTPCLMLLFTVGGMVGAVRRLLWSLKKHSGQG